MPQLEVGELPPVPVAGWGHVLPPQAGSRREGANQHKVRPRGQQPEAQLSERRQQPLLTEGRVRQIVEKQFALIFLTIVTGIFGQLSS